MNETSGTTTIVAIDGPSGVGKSTTSRLVAECLGLPHIDTGAMYRAIALEALRRGVALDDEAGLETIASGASIEFGAGEAGRRIFLDGHDVSDEIRRPEISLAASTVSAVPAVRRVLVALQRRIGRRTGGVLEGRDIGTRVFPDTPHKIFLTARPEIRAERRYRELLAQGVPADRSQVHDEMEKRDFQDTTRADSPLSYDPSYTLIDTSELSIGEVVDRVVRSVQERRRHDARSLS